MYSLLGYHVTHHVCISRKQLSDAVRQANLLAFKEPLKIS